MLGDYYKTYGAGSESVDAAASVPPLAAQWTFFLFGVEVFLADNLGLGK